MKLILVLNVLLIVTKKLDQEDLYFEENVRIVGTTLDIDV
jgi:hypothetical protein